MQPEAHSVTVELAGQEYEFETGRIARQATGAVLVRNGDNTVLATVVAAEEPRQGIGFLPLTVEYREKLAAAGRIPGNFTRREGRISDHEVLVSRLVDRTLRSLFPEEYRCEVQIQIAVLSADPDADLASLGLLAATAAVHVSPTPARGPAAGLRVARRDGVWNPLPSHGIREEAELEFFVGSGPDGLVMAEGTGREISEADCMEALKQGANWVKLFQDAFETLHRAVGVVKRVVPKATELPQLPEQVRDPLQRALEIRTKAERARELASVRREYLAGMEAEITAPAAEAFDACRHQLVREQVLSTGVRPDGRGPEAIRPIWSEVGWLPRAHGSAVFTRGETQALVTCTLGSSEDAQRVDGLRPRPASRFILHYNFPPYSVGEIRPLRGPGRREIGHGSLARRGLANQLPTFEDFPYTIRLEAEISESNGSSSMATVCGGSLALMQAGVPLARPTAGIAMGLITDGNRSIVLSDITGEEDHLGDMDLKVVGTARGVTAVQLDNKLGGLELDLLSTALEQAHRGRVHILEEMAKTISAPCPELPSHAPRVMRTAIMPESIGVLVGPRGANIKSISETTGARISVDDDGTVLVYASESSAASKALAMVHRSAGIVRVDRCYRAAVTGVRDFGVFVRINRVTEGMIPTAELDDSPPANPGPPLREGDEVVVKVLGADDRGRLRLSRRAALGVDETMIDY
jgi:polyribonucleotide nucleotidyltransferase